MADLSGFTGTGFEQNSDVKAASKGVDAELEGFLMMEKQKAQLTAQVNPRTRFWCNLSTEKTKISYSPRCLRSFTSQLFFSPCFLSQIHEFNDFCWDKCVDKPGIKLDGRTETCLNNCVDRFIDVSLLITNRFSQLLQKSAGGLWWFDPWRRTFHPRLTLIGY